MDFPKSVPGVGLINGQFIDENMATGQPGSLIPSVWGNSVTHEILNVLAAAGVEPDEHKTNQLAEAISKIVTGSSIPWMSITEKPTTLEGFGLTDARSLKNSWFDTRISARAGISLAQSASVDFLNADDTASDYRIVSSTGGLSVYSFNSPSGGAPAVTLQGSTGQAFFAARPVFAGKAPWDSGNLNPDDKVDSDRCRTAGFAGDDASVPYMKHTNGTVVTLATKSYVEGRLAQATEATEGVAKVATSEQLNAGVDDTSMLTSKKIRLGFYASLTTNGYIVFPQWLGSFIIQWGRYSLAAPTGSSVAITFPIPFGGTFPPMPWAGVDGGATDQIGTQGVTTTSMLISKGSADISARTGSWFAFGGAF